MKNEAISLQKLAYFAILLYLGVYTLIIGQSILTPLAFGALFAFMLKPICAFFEKHTKRSILSIILTMLTAIVPVCLIIYFFSTQFVDVIQDMPSIKEKLNAGFSKIYDWLRSAFGYTQAEADKLFSEQMTSLLDAPLSFLGVGFTSSTSFLTGLLLALIYVFLFLLYRSSFKNFILFQAPKGSRSSVQELIDSIQGLIQKYLYGLLSVILILGLMNSVGLLIIGIKHAFFWGFLAATLAIIPYVGTFIGGLLPFLYALATTDQMWQPTAVVILFMVVQGLEGNLITPNVVGSSIKINPLAAIVSLLIGAQIWGIAGMVLALPAVAVVKEVMKRSDAWRPVGFLLSDEIGEREHIFKRRWDSERFRLRNFFKKKV